MCRTPRTGLRWADDLILRTCLAHSPCLSPATPSPYCAFHSNSTSQLQPWMRKVGGLTASRYFTGWLYLPKCHPRAVWDYLRLFPKAWEATPRSHQKKSSSARTIPRTISKLPGPSPHQDGRRSEAIKTMAKAAKESLKMGKRGGPPIYTNHHSLREKGILLNKRETEALNLNAASLWVPWHGLEVVPGLTMCEPLISNTWDLG